MPPRMIIGGWGFGRGVWYPPQIATALEHGLRERPPWSDRSQSRGGGRGERKKIGREEEEEDRYM